MQALPFMPLFFNSLLRSPEWSGVLTARNFPIRGGFFVNAKNHGLTRVLEPRSQVPHVKGSKNVVLPSTLLTGP